MTGAPPAPIRYVFSDGSSGDLRGNSQGLSDFAQRHSAPPRIARLRQVHGAKVVRVEAGGDHGEADALFTTEADLTLAIFVADCAAVVVGGRGGVGLAHVGWRGAVAGVVPALLEQMKRAGIEIESAALGPMIGPCCFEVGPEVVAQFGNVAATTTTWGTPSVDLAQVIADQLPFPLTGSPGCTMHDERYLSFRRQTSQISPMSPGGDRDARMVALAWKAM